MLTHNVIAILLQSYTSDGDNFIQSKSYEKSYEVLLFLMHNLTH